MGEVGKKADLAGISREQMTRWRRGRLKINPSLSNLERLAEVLDLRIGIAEIASGEVAEAGAEYEGTAVPTREDLMRDQKRLRDRIKRLERQLDRGAKRD